MSIVEKQAVVLIHGLYLRAWSMKYIAGKLEEAGFSTYSYSYKTTRKSPAENADGLNDFIRALPESRVNLVGHSLGGLLIRHLFVQHPDQPPGRIVTLGTPHQGSYVARFGVHLKLSWMFRRALEKGLVGGASEWTGERELGSLAGSKNVGVGLLVPGKAEPGDGTVAIAETRLNHMTDHVTLPVTHSTMLFSKAVSAQMKSFLQHGRFDHRV